MFQSPSLRGSGRFVEPDGTVRITVEVSIPFIAGQWSLPCPLQAGGVSEKKFQSPSLRGSGRFFDAAALIKRLRKFQSPSLRGSGRFVISTYQPDSIPYKFQSPSLRGSGRFQRVFHPRGVGGEVSIPFIAGQWSLHAVLTRRRPRTRRVSIPFIAGQWSLL